MQTTRTPESKLVRGLKRQGFVAVKVISYRTKKDLGRDLINLGTEILSESYSEIQVVPARQVLSKGYKFEDSIAYVAYATEESSSRIIMAPICGPSGRSFMQL